MAEPLLSAATAASVACLRSPICWLGEFVDDDDRDIAQRRALLLDQRRVDEDRQQHRQRQPRHAVPRARRHTQRQHQHAAPASAAIAHHGSSGAAAIV